MPENVNTVHPMHAHGCTFVGMYVSKVAYLQPCTVGTIFTSFTHYHIIVQSIIADLRCFSIIISIHL